jgi:HSP20 family protein
MIKNNEVAVVQRGNTLPAVQVDTQDISVTPSTDIFETPDAYVLKIDLPGCMKDAIKVTMEHGTMTVKAKVESYHREGGSLLFNELKTPTYYRAFNMADGIDRQSIDAQYDDGVLTVKLLKKEETKAKEIEIK